MKTGAVFQEIVKFDLINLKGSHIDITDRKNL
jgi:hypothetical protein